MSGNVLSKHLSAPYKHNFLTYCAHWLLDAFLAQIELDKDIFPDEQDMQIAKQVADLSLDLPKLKVLVDETD